MGEHRNRALTRGWAWIGRSQLLSCVRLHINNIHRGNSVSMEPEALGSAKTESQIRADERQRFKAILGLPEAEGRTELACAIIIETDLTPDQAAAMLSSSASVKTTPNSGNPFAEAMAAIENPRLIFTAPDHEA